MVSAAASAIEQISAAMSVCNLQHQVNVTNIANRDTQGYQRLQLRFERAMGEPDAATVVSDRSNVPVSLEQDLVAMSTNLMHYQTMARALGRYFSVIAAIANPARG
jgi:flagellar basal body rod protein FlgB